VAPGESVPWRGGASRVVQGEQEVPQGGREQGAGLLQARHGGAHGNGGAGRVTSRGDGVVHGVQVVGHADYAGGRGGFAATDDLSGEISSSSSSPPQPQLDAARRAGEDGRRWTGSASCRRRCSWTRPGS
jgi:hypothetical protein